MKRNVSAIIALGALFLATVPSSAQTEDTATRPRRTEERVAKVKAQRAERLAQLGLSDSQQADLKKIRETAREDGKSKRTALKTARNDLQTLLRADTVDEQAISGKLAEVQAAQGALMKIRIDSALAMKRVLTPEQQKKMAEMRAAHKGDRSANHSRMGKKIRERARARRQSAQ